MRDYKPEQGSLTLYVTCYHLLRTTVPGEDSSLSDSLDRAEVDWEVFKLKTGTVTLTLHCECVLVCERQRYGILSVVSRLFVYCHIVL